MNVLATKKCRTMNGKKVDTFGVLFRPKVHAKKTLIERARTIKT